MFEDIDLFDFAEKQGIIREGFILTQEYIPDKIISRDDQIKEIALLTKPIFRGSYPKHCLINGPVGSGKTIVANHVFSRLSEKIEQDKLKLEYLKGKKEELEAQGLTLENEDKQQYELLSYIVPNVNIKWVHISCRETPTPAGILYKIITYLEPTINLARRGTSKDVYYNRLYDIIRTKNIGLIAVFDEIDFLTDDSILYNFSRALAAGNLTDRQFITVIGITNALESDKTLDDRVKSSTIFEKIVFPPYSVDDIFHILSARIKKAFAPNSIDMETLITCASRAHDAGGDIRFALKVLKTAAEFAEEDEKNIIEIPDIYLAFEAVQKNELIETLRKLTRRQQIVLLAIIKLLAYKFTPTTGQITQVYSLLCKYLQLDTLDTTIVSKSISTLELFNIIQVYSRNEGRRGGNTRLVTVKGEDQEKIKDTLYDDDVLEGLKLYNPIEDNQHIIYENNRKRGYIQRSL